MEADKKMTLRPQTPCCSGWSRNVGRVQISQSWSICRYDESMAERKTCGVKEQSRLGSGLRAANEMLK